MPAHGPGIRSGLETLAPVILGQDPRLLETVERAMDLQLPGHLYAKQPVDMACWDILGQATGLSIADLLGGRGAKGTPVASSVSSGEPDYMMGIIDSYRERGYVAHSAKVGGSDTEKDIVAIRSVTRSPISVDESLVTLQEATRIARDGIADVFGIKLNRVGGFTKARRMRDIAMAHGIQLFVMATGGSVLADTEAAHLAQSVPDEFIQACWSCQDMLTLDIAPGSGPRCTDGHITVDATPGLGVVPDEKLLGNPVAIYEGEKL